MSSRLGFTIIEMMVVLVIVAILAAVGLPAYNDTIARNRRETSANQFVGVLAFARSEAMMRGSRVVVCRTADPTASGGPVCANGTDWASGMLVYHDANSNMTRDAGGTNPERLLRVINAQPTGVAINVAAANQGGIVFNRLGQAQGASSTNTFSAVVDIRVCHGDMAQVLGVSTTGRVSNSESTCQPPPAASSSSSSVSLPSPLLP